MPYVSEGQVVEKRSVWRLSIITDAVWGAVNFVGLFFSSLFSDPTTTRGNSNVSRPVGGSSASSRPGNGQGPRRPMGGINHRGTINQPMGMGGCCG